MPKYDPPGLAIDQLDMTLYNRKQILVQRCGFTRIEVAEVNFEDGGYLHVREADLYCAPLTMFEQWWPFPELRK